MENKFVILGVASKWESRKGLQYFVKLSKMLSEGEIIALVGLSKKQLEILPPNIIGIARTNSINELAEIYSAADVFVNPTLEENYPTVNLEAQACGTPVVTFNTGGSPETIDESTGYVVKKGDMNELLKAIKKIETDGKKTYFERCVSRAKIFSNKYDRFQEYVSLYTELPKELKISAK